MQASRDFVYLDMEMSWHSSSIKKDKQVSPSASFFDLNWKQLRNFSNIIYFISIVNIYVSRPEKPSRWEETKIRDWRFNRP
jgi:hypothetical protein